MTKRTQKLNRISKTCALLTFLILVASIIFQVSITNKFAVKGSEMVSLKNQKSSLEKEVSLLQLRASELGSMSKIENEARQLGFVEYNQSVSVITTQQFAAAR